ncbi:ankyrin repeat-containing domain protein [Aspergillus varians]
MSLLVLPNELILGILAEINSERDINSFIQSSRTLYYLGKPHLYRNNAAHHHGSALLWGAERGNMETVESALDNRADINMKVEQSRVTPLVLAAENGHIDTIKLLLNRGADVNACTAFRETPLLVAAKEGHADVVDILLNQPDILPDMADSTELTPLSWACTKGNLQIAETLLARDDVDINHRSSTGSTALYEAAMGDDFDVVALLLSDPTIDSNPVSTYDGTTPLMMAALYGITESVRLLLNHPKTNIDARDNQKRGALYYAVQGNDPIIAGWLIDYGIDVNHKDEAGQTALSLAVELGVPEMVAFLLSYGADPTIADSRGLTPLHRAVQMGNRMFGKVLYEDGRITLEQAASMDKADSYRARWEANWDEHYEAMELLMERDNVDVNARDERGWTPFTWAAAVNVDEQRLGLLLAHPQVTMNARDDKGFTALYHAARRGHQGFVEALLRHPGIDGTIHNDKPRNMLGTAEGSGHYRTPHPEITRFSGRIGMS